jgi:thiamine-phosphate pyrophosphorylase
VAFAAELPRVLAGADVACFLLRSDDDDAAVRRVAGVLAPIVRDRGGAFLIDGRTRLARELDADGAHVDAAEGAAARQELGVECGLSRHLAMEAADRGADYVAFGSPGADAAVLDMVAWWSPLFVVPCIAWAATIEAAGALARAGADFVAVDDLVWRHAQGPVAGLEAVRSVLG